MREPRVCIILWFIYLYCDALAIRRAKSRLNLRNIVSVVDPFWESRLSFKCQGCGKCCVNEGDVWFSTEEFGDLASKLRISAQEALDKYSELVLSGWVKIKD